MSAPRPQPRWITCVVLLFTLYLCGCTYLSDYVNEAMPPTPSPFPTLAQLPTVTPMTPSPTLPPTMTPRPIPTDTPIPQNLQGTVAVGANVRAEPGLNTEILTSVLAGNPVTLLERTDDWYRVRLADGVEGWMSAEVVEVMPDTVQQVPTALIQPDAQTEGGE